MCKGRTNCAPCAAAKLRKKTRASVSRKNSNPMRKVLKVAEQGLYVYGGQKLGKLAANNLPILKDNPLLGGIALVFVSSLAKGGAKSLMQGIALGVASEGVATVLDTGLGGITSGLGIGNQAYSNQNPGVSNRRMYVN